MLFLVTLSLSLNTWTLKADHSSCWLVHFPACFYDQPQRPFVVDEWKREKGRRQQLIWWGRQYTIMIIKWIVIYYFHFSHPVVVVVCMRSVVWSWERRLEKGLPIENHTPSWSVSRGVGRHDDLSANTHGQTHEIRETLIRHRDPGRLHLV